jgi:hypothetical protein
MTKKGVEFARECLIFEVCQPQQGGKTILATVKPAALLAMFRVPQLEPVAQEVEDAIIRIMKEATAG